MNELEVLRARLERAALRLGELAKDLRGSERIRLHGKLEGVRLAGGYVDEMLRMDVPLTSNEQADSWRALIRERNTWARQMADLRDERDDALNQAAEAKSELRRVSNEYDQARITFEMKTEDVQAAALRDAAASYGPPLTPDVRRWLRERADKIVDPY